MDWGSFAEWATVIVTVPTLVYAVVQLGHARRSTDLARKATEAEVRPYVWVKYLRSTNGAGEGGVRLHLENSGRTPALDVVLDFSPDGAPWCETSSEHFAFVSGNGGVRILAPGHALDYYVGAWNPDSVHGKQWESRATTSVTIRYRTMAGQRFEEELVLSVRDASGTGTWGDGLRRPESSPKTKAPRARPASP